MADLPIQPDYSSSLNKQPRVHRVPLGDGYEQRAAAGINTNPDKWSLIWDELTDADVDILLSFFDDLNAVATFTWTSPYASAPKKYVCDRWGATPISDNNHRFTASIYQVYEP